MFPLEVTGFIEGRHFTAGRFIIPRAALYLTLSKSESRSMSSCGAQIHNGYEKCVSNFCRTTIREKPNVDGKERLKWRETRSVDAEVT